MGTVSFIGGFNRLRAENHGSKAVDECEQTALPPTLLHNYGGSAVVRSTTAPRRMSLNSIEGGPADAPTQNALRRIRRSSERAKAEAKRRRVDKGTTPVKAWGSINNIILQLKRVDWMAAL